MALVSGIYGNDSALLTNGVGIAVTHFSLAVTEHFIGSLTWRLFDAYSILAPMGARSCETFNGCRSEDPLARSFIYRFLLQPFDVRAAGAAPVFVAIFVHVTGWVCPCRDGLDLCLGLLLQPPKVQSCSCIPSVSRAFAP